MSASHSPQTFEAPLQRLAQGLNTVIDRDTLHALTRYLDLVATWNERIDLTAARTPEAMTEVLVADALVLARPSLITEGAHILDVGTGAGGPAIPLMLLRPDLRATLVEPLQKRVAFLRQALTDLALTTRARLIDARIDPRRPKLDHPVDVAMSRATFAPETWLAIGSRLASVTLVLTVKPDPLPMPKGTTLSDVIVYQLPFSGAPRAIHSCRRG